MKKPTKEDYRTAARVLRFEIEKEQGSDEATSLAQQILGLTATGLDIEADKLETPTE